ncbi:MAG: sterol desaturase family protein [Myxococcota bacterium]
MSHLPTDTKHPVFSPACLKHAEASWQPLPESKDTAQPRFHFFHSPVLDRLFQSAPWVPYCTLGPFVLVALIYVWGRHTWTLGLGLLTAGVLLWTLIEYAMHRFLFHFPRERPVQKVFGLIVHGHHHLYPADRTRLVATPLMHWSMMLLFWGLYTGLFGSYGLALWTGTGIGYLLYELLHWLAHHGPLSNTWRKRLFGHHLKHHYENPNANFGISSPLWDIVFRTRF